MSYDAFKVVHLAGVVIFLGNIIVTAMWKVLADRTGDPRIIAYAQRLVTITDWIFTAGVDPTQFWLALGQSLFVASGVIWIAILIPTQIIQARQARAFAAGGP